MDNFAMECIDRMRAMGLTYGFMTPDYVGTLAYNAHTGGDESQKNSLTKSIAKNEVELFKSLTSELGSTAGVFLHKVRLEFVSLANAIARAKSEHLEKLKNINDQFAEQEAAVSGNWVSRANWRTVYRIATISGFAATGATLARALIPVFSDTTAENTGYTLPTLAGACLAVWAGNALTGWWQEHKRNRVGNARRLRFENAWKEYNNERFHQITKHLERLHSTWYEYTGVEYWISIENSHAKIIKDDMDLTEKLDREFERRNMSPMELCWQICAQGLTKLRQRKNKEDNSLPSLKDARSALH